MTVAPHRLTTALADRYTIERELGAGGMATVYLTHDVKHDRKVALKVLKPELAAVVGADRFLTEIRTTANLQHPHILPLFDSGEADGFLYFVMPYVEGESLRDRLDREKQLPVDEAARITTEVADALSHAHANGVIHRDIKPANILLRDGRVQVADFGIALAVSAAGGARLTETGLSVGTPHYMSPEQAAGDRRLDGRSDVYSLGCVLYEMLAGEPPHTGATAQSILSKILTEEPKPISKVRRSVPPNVEEAVHAALEKLPADRIQSASDFIGAMYVSSADSRRALLPVAGRARLPRRSGLAGSSWKRNSLLAISVAVAALFGYVVRMSSEPPDPPSTSVRSRITFDETAGDPALSPDGAHLVYSVSECPTDQSCRAQLRVQDMVAWGDPLPIGPTVRSDLGEPPPNFFWSIEWSPDGQRILYSALFAEDSTRTGLYSMPWLGGTPTKIADGVVAAGVFRPDEEFVDWIEFPDGRGALPVIRSRSIANEAIESHLPATSTPFRIRTEETVPLRLSCWMPVSRMPSEVSIRMRANTLEPHIGTAGESISSISRARGCRTRRRASFRRGLWDSLRIIS